jgi:hypothetical protein
MVAKYKAQLQPGERLAKGPQGFVALGPGEAVPPGHVEIP